MPKAKKKGSTPAELTNDELALMYHELNYRLTHVENQIKQGMGEYVGIMPPMGFKVIVRTPMSPETIAYMDNHLVTRTLRSAHAKLKAIYDLTQWGQEGVNPDEFNVRQNLEQVVVAPYNA